MRGSDIPIGARIIAVVDCFDALTSDRPYRRALPADRALRMILESRGVRYDPAVVDALVRIKDSLDAPLGLTAKALDPTTQSTQGTNKSNWLDPAISTTTVALAGRLGQLIGRQQDLAALCHDIYEQLAVVNPSLTIVVYRYDLQLDASSD